MPIKLDLTESQAVKYGEFLEAQLKELYAKIDPLLDERDDLEDAIKQLKNGHIAPKTVAQPSLNISTEAGIYNPKGTTISKIKFVLNETKVPTYTRQIIDRIFELQPELKADKELKDKTAKNISTVLSIGKDKDFSRTVDDTGNFLFTIKEQ